MRAAAALAIAAAATAAAAGCSFQRRSSDYSCDTPADCGAGRTCDNGWCVEIGGPTIDADPNAPDADPNAPDGTPADAFVCPVECGFCDELNICHISCNTGDVGAPCNAAPVVCPPGIACKVECQATDSCAMGIDCSDASNCRVECTGIRSCGGPITCGEGPCHIECTSTDTCGDTISCPDSCSCFTDCMGAGSCAGTITCPVGCSQGGECRNNQQECSTCTGG